MTKLMKELEELPHGFATPIDLPRTAEEHDGWQEANRSWWECNPMRYDWKSGIQHDEFSRSFYEEIDRRFFEAVALYAPCKKIPFDWLIDFEELRSKDVLEIGVGNGSHAQLLATHAKSFRGIDLTEYAVKSTTARLRVFDLPGNVEQMDAERLRFADASFDFIWTWGVIHHSANTRKILEEMHRVLKPGGKAIVMVYHRTLWEYYVQGTMLAVLSGHFAREGSVHASIQQRTDGAIARYYKISEWKNLVSDLFAVREVRVYGKKTELVPIPAGRVKDVLVDMIPNSLSRFLTNTCRWGSFLVTKLEKEAA